MNPQNFNRILSSDAELDLVRTRELSSIVEEFPYFQAARALQLKGLYQSHSFLYNSALKLTAAYTTDRGVLFDYITSDEFRQHRVSENIKVRTRQEKLAEVEETELMSPDDAEKVLDPELFEEEKTKTATIEQEIQSEIIDSEEITTLNPEESEKIITFDKTEPRSFSEWLKLSRSKPVERKPKKEISDEKMTREQEIIERFIENDPKISRGKASNAEIFTRDYEPDSPLMTETLARIYAEQKNYLKAIQAYKILILKNPKKSGLFADRIREIENLIENKNK